MKSVLALVTFAGLAAGCVSEVGGDDLPPPNPAPPGAGNAGAGSGSNTGGSQTDITASGYLEKIAQIHCEQSFSCRATYPGEQTAFEATWTTSIDSCITMLVDAWRTNTIETEIAKGRIDYDGTAAVDCLGGVAFSACDMHWTTGIQWAESCYSVMIGNVQVGGSCDNRYSCESYNCDVVQHVCLARN